MKQQPEDILLYILAMRWKGLIRITLRHTESSHTDIARDPI